MIERRILPAGGLSRGGGGLITPGGGLARQTFGFTGKFPRDAIEWGQKYPAITTPTAIYTCQESSGSLIDQVGSVDLAPLGTPTYRNAGDVGRMAVGFDAVAEGFQAASNTSFDPDGSTSYTYYWRTYLPDNGASTMAIGGKRGGAGAPGHALFLLATSGNIYALLDDGPGTFAETDTPDYGDAAWHDLMMVVDRSGQLLSVFVDGTDSPSPTDITTAVSPTNTGVYSLGTMAGIANAISGQLYSYHAVWEGAALTFAEFTSIVNG